MRSQKDKVWTISLCNLVLAILLVLTVKGDTRRRRGGGAGRDIYMIDKGGAVKTKENLYKTK